MKNVLVFTTILTTPFLFLSCSQKETEQTSKKQDITNSITPYPLEICLVSGEKLGSMGDPYIINYEGQEIKFCCAGCEPKFNKNPSKFLTQILTK